MLLSCFSRVQLCATPQMAAHQAPLSLGFSRQEHWSGLPFPSSVHKSEVKVKSLSRVRLLATPWTASYQAPPPMGFPRQEYWSGVPSPSLVAFIRCLENYGSGHFPSSRGNQNVFLSCLLMTPARSFSLPSIPAGGRLCHLHANNTKLVC